MPGVIMENRSKGGAHTNHDRDSMANGTNGRSVGSERALEKGKGRSEPLQDETQLSVTNGVNGVRPAAPLPSNMAESAIPADMMEQLRQLPPEIEHITEGFQPLSTLLSRLAQVTHNRLSNKITELASMATPTSAVNGNGAHYGNGADDNSIENVRKKVQLLKFAEETHADWAKVLVITQWSRISEDVSKVIDLKVHLDTKRNTYLDAIHELSEVKRSLVYARLPNPDLKTAVEVLSTGKASWMPDLGYLEAPPLSAKDLLKSLENLNTLLSIRMNLQEYDKIPYHFRDYSIKSGRVTFKVADEFEVDLTIANENPESQFWFIDFRFLFSPSPSSLPERFRFMIESRVNAALEKDGLSGCYKFLHELVLTHKITELRRQAIEMARGKWVETLFVEPLDRALSIQYWLNRYGQDGPKSWIILGIHSGRRKDRLPHPKDTSKISIRWFRDSKEVLDAQIPLDLTEISTESLMQNIVKRHISHILSSVHEKLSVKPLFANKDLRLSFANSPQGLEESELTVQLTHREHIAVRIEPITGLFAISPTSRLASQAERKLNTQSRDPALNAHEFIENLRCVSMSEAIISRALSVGWMPTRNPGLKSEDLKPIVPRDTLQISWFRRKGWSKDWFVALSSSMGGERWWLIEITSVSEGLKIKSHIQIPLTTVSPDPTHEFLTGIHLYSAAILSQYVNARALHSQRVLYIEKEASSSTVAAQMKVPAIFLQLKKLPIINQPSALQKPWAKEVLKLSFQGLMPSRPLKSLPAREGSPSLSHGVPVESGISRDMSDPNRIDDADETAIIVAEASMIRPIPSRLLVKQRVDRDVAFHPSSGAFAIRIQTQVGEPAITALMERLHRVQQLVQFVQTVNAHSSNLRCETVSLGRVVFSYSLQSSLNNANATPLSTYRATIDFAGSTNKVNLTLERDNPHIRILDLLSKVLNDPSLGLNGLANLLPLTLPVLMGLDSLERTWSSLSDQGDLAVFVRASDYYAIRYSLIIPGSDDETLRIAFYIRLQHRGREPWWCIRRDRDRTSPVNNDDIDNALKAVWDGEDEGEVLRWRGMQNAGIGRGDGIGELIERVDAVIRDVVVPSLQNQSQNSWNGNGIGDPGEVSMHFGKDGAEREMIIID